MPSTKSKQVYYDLTGGRCLRVKPISHSWWQNCRYVPDTGKHILIDVEVRETCNGYTFGEILHVPQMFLFTMGTGHTNHQADCTKLPRSTEYGDSP